MAKIAKKSQNLKKSAVTSKESIVKEEKDNFGSSMNEPEVRSANSLSSALPPSIRAVNTPPGLDGSGHSSKMASP